MLVDDLDLLSARSLRTVPKPELNMITFDQTTISSRRAMHEYIVTAVIRCDKAETFGGVIPLDDASHHGQIRDIDIRLSVIAAAAAAIAAAISAISVPAATWTARLGIRISFENCDICRRRALHARACYKIDSVTFAECLHTQR